MEGSHPGCDGLRNKREEGKSRLSVDLSSKKFNEESKKDTKEGRVCRVLSIALNGKDLSETKVKWL